MSTEIQKYYVDYRKFGDNGQDVVDSIQPVSDGQPANQTTFRRPSENLRNRTEEARTTLEDLLYYRDTQLMALEQAGGSSITWSGPFTGAPGTGIITQNGTIVVRPFWTPRTSTHPNLVIGTAVPNNRIGYQVPTSAYTTQGTDTIFIQHIDGGSGAPLTVNITPGPLKLISTTFDSTNPAHDAPAAAAIIQAAVTLDPELSGLLLINAIGTAGNTISPQVEIHIEGAADQEAHSILANTLTTFTTTNPLSSGDSLCIWYRWLVEPNPGSTEGGRRESNPNRGTDVIPVGSLFITSTEPEKIPGCVPLCKVVGSELVWISGDRYVPGMTGPLGTSPNVFVNSTGFTGIMTQASNGGITTPLVPSNSQEAFNAINSNLGHYRTATWVCTDGVTSLGGRFNGSNALQNALATNSGGLIFLRRGTYTLPDPSYLLATNTQIVGEGRDQVTIVFSNVAAPAFNLNANCELRNVSVDYSGVGLTVTNLAGQSNTVVDNVRFIKPTLLSYTDNGHVVSRVSFPVGLLASIIAMAGTGHTINNILGSFGFTFNGAVSVSVSDCGSAYNANGSAIPFILATNSVVDFVGVNANATSTLGGVAELLRATNSTINFNTCILTHSAPTATRFALSLDSCKVGIFGSTITVDNGAVLRQQQISGTVSDTVIDNCTVTVLSAANASDLFDVQDLDVYTTIRNTSIFSGTSGLGRLVLGGSSNTDSKRMRMQNCHVEFSYGTILGKEGMAFTDAVIEDCSFLVTNSFSVLRGAATGYADPAILGLNTDLVNTSLDVADLPVDGAGLFGGAALFADIQIGTLRNFVVRNVNKTIGLSLADSGLISVSSGKVSQSRIIFSGSGINVGIRSYYRLIDSVFEDVQFTNHVNASGSIANANFFVLKGACTIRNVLTGASASGFSAPSDISGTALEHVTFGSTVTPCYSFMNIAVAPLNDVHFRDVAFYTTYGAGPVLVTDDLTYSDLTNVNLVRVGAAAPVAMIDFGGGGGATFLGFKMNHVFGRMQGNAVGTPTAITTSATVTVKGAGNRFEIFGVGGPYSANANFVIDNTNDYV